jgi:hypothetical protein
VEALPVIVTMARLARLEVSEQHAQDWAIDLAQTDTTRVERRIDRKLKGITIEGGFWNRCEMRELAAALLKIADEVVQ